MRVSTICVLGAAAFSSVCASEAKGGVERRGHSLWDAASELVFQPQSAGKAVLEYAMDAMHKVQESALGQTDRSKDWLNIGVEVTDGIRCTYATRARH